MGKTNKTILIVAGAIALLALAALLVLVVINAPSAECGNDLCEFHQGENTTSCAQDCSAEPVIQSARVVGEPFFHKRYGDIWTNTWADDDHVYAGWGDGTGQADCYPYMYTNPKRPFPHWPTKVSPKGCRTIGDPCDNVHDCPLLLRFCNVFECGTAKCYPPCEYTDAGLVVLKGNPPSFKPCASP